MKYPLDSHKDAAAWLFKHGANVLSLDGKSPEPIEWKPWQTKRQDLEKVKQLPWHRDGVGIICGIGNFRCLDFDGTEEGGVKFGAIEKVLNAWGFPHTYPWIVASGSGNGYHVWFRCEDDERFSGNTEFDPKRESAFDHLELRWDSVQTAVPPSIHPDTGDRYEFYRKCPEGAPWEVNPGEVEEAIQSVARRRNSTTSNGRSLDVPETIPEGKRNNTLTSVAGTLRNRGLGTEEMEEMLQTVNEKRCSPPLPEEEVRKIARSVERYEPAEPITDGADAHDSDSWGAVRSSYEDDAKGEARVEATDKVLNRLDVATHRESRHIYAWDEEDKVYRDDGEQRIHEVLVNGLGPHHSQHEVREIKGKVRPLTYADGFGEEGVIPVANGDLILDEDGGVRLEDATPERLIRTRSPASWDPDAEAPRFQNFLEESIPDDRERETVQEYTGYALMSWALPFHRALFIVGPTASGKSTFLSTVEALLGKVADLSPQQIVDDRFGAIELEGAWANTHADIPTALVKNIGLFKQVVAGDRIFVERKHEQGHSLKPLAKHFYSANQLPEVQVDDDAFFRRILLVSFPIKVPREERDEALPGRLEDELDGVLRWAIKGLQRVIDQGGFTHDRTPDETRRRWEEHTSSIGQFKAAALEITGGDQDVEAKQDVYSAYTEFCDKNGLSKETQQMLTRKLKRDPDITDGNRTPPAYETQKKSYVGLRIESDWHPKEFEPDDEIPF